MWSATTQPASPGAGQIDVNRGRRKSQIGKVSQPSIALSPGSARAPSSRARITIIAYSCTSALGSDNFGQLGSQLVPAEHLPVADELVAQPPVGHILHRAALDDCEVGSG